MFHNKQNSDCIAWHFLEDCTFINKYVKKYIFVVVFLKWRCYNQYNRAQAVAAWNRRTNMEKIICNICGTSYPDTADCCPICGFGKDGKLFEPVDEILLEEESAEKTHETVKGGRFSRPNASKRSDAVPAKDPFQDEDDDEKYGEPTPPVNKDKQGSNMGLIVTLVVLLLAIVAVIIYIYLSFFAPQGEKKPNSETTEPKSSTTEQINTNPAIIPAAIAQIMAIQTLTSLVIRTVHTAAPVQIDPSTVRSATSSTLKVI